MEEDRDPRVRDRRSHRSLDEVAHRLGDRFVIDPDEVVGSGELQPLRMRDLCREIPARLDRYDGILGAMNHQRADADMGQEGADVEFAECAEQPTHVSRARGAAQIATPPVAELRVGLARGCVHLDGDGPAPAGDETLLPRLEGLACPRPRRLFAIADRRRDGSEEDQTFDELRMRGCEQDRDRAAGRGSEHEGLLRSLGREHGAKVLDRLVQRRR
jgi:hypothetical protein